MPDVKLLALKNQKSFNIVNKKAIKFVNRFFILVYSSCPAVENLSRKALISNQKGVFLGLKVPKKFGKAVERNKLRRQIKHITRDLMSLYYESAAIIFIPKSSVKILNFLALKNEVEKAIIFCQKNKGKALCA